MKYRKWFRKFAGIGVNVSNRVTEHVMGTVIFRKWENLYNKIATEVNSNQASERIPPVSIPETGTTTTEDLNLKELTTEKDLELYGAQIIQLMNNMNRAKDKDQERITDKLLKEKYHSQLPTPILESIITRDYETIIKANKEIEEILKGTDHLQQTRPGRL